MIKTILILAVLLVIIIVALNVIVYYSMKNIFDEDENFN